jgi:hypothetical protein
MVRSWMACGLVGVIAAIAALGCGHTQRQCCCPCQCSAPEAVTPAPAIVPEKVPAPKTTTSAKRTSVLQLTPVSKSLRIE